MILTFISIYSFINTILLYTTRIKFSSIERVPSHTQRFVIYLVKLWQPDEGPTGRQGASSKYFESSYPSTGANQPPELGDDLNPLKNSCRFAKEDFANRRK